MATSRPRAVHLSLPNHVEFLRQSILNSLLENKFADVEIVFGDLDKLEVSRLVVWLVFPDVVGNLDIDQVILPDLTRPQCEIFLRKFFSVCRKEGSGSDEQTEFKPDQSSYQSSSMERTGQNDRKKPDRPIRHIDSSTRKNGSDNKRNRRCLTTRIQDSDTPSSVPVLRTGNIGLEDAADDRIGTWCTVCGKKFNSQKSLILHEVLACNLYGSDIKKRWREGMKKTTGDMSKDRVKQESGYICEACPMLFQNITSLRTHQTTEHSELGLSKFVCRFCKKIFRFPVQLLNHERSHTKEKPFQCELCDRMFSHKCNLKSHMETHKDAKDREFKCSSCVFTATSKVLLNLHMNYHTGERPYVCKTCGLSYRRPSHLRRHQANSCSKDPLGDLPRTKKSKKQEKVKSAENC